MPTFLAVVYMFGASYLPFDSKGMEGIIQNKQETTQVEFMLGIDLFDCFTVYGGERTRQEMVSAFNFFPYEQKYYCGATLHVDFYDAMKVEAGILRSCSHPTHCWGREKGAFDSAELEISFTVSGRIKVM